MINLADQYSKLRTYKRRIYYSDFVADSTSRYTATLFDLPRTWEVLFTKIWLREVFARSSLTTCQLYVTNDQDLSVLNINTRAFSTLNLLSPVSDRSGVINSAPPLVNSTVTPVGNYIANQSAPTGVVARIITNAVAGPPSFTAGYFDLWVMACKLP